MIYTGYTEGELQKVISILQKHNVPFDVMADESAITAAEELISDDDYHIHKKAGSVNNSFYALSIDQTALKALPANILRELEKHRVWPEQEPPPELHEESVPKEPKAPTFEKTKWAAIIILVMVGVLIFLEFFEGNDLYLN